MRDIFLLTCATRGDNGCGCENDNMPAGECGESLAAADTCWPLLKLLFTMGLSRKRINIVGIFTNHHVCEYITKRHGGYLLLWYRWRMGVWMSESVTRSHLDGSPVIRRNLRIWDIRSLKQNFFTNLNNAISWTKNNRAVFNWKYICLKSNKTKTAINAN